MPSNPVEVRGLIVGSTSILASPAHPRSYLMIANLSPTDTIHIAFDKPAVAAITAGQFLLLPAVSGAGTNLSATSAAGFHFEGGFVPANAIYLVSTGIDTPVTIME